MRFFCFTCGKSISSELPEGAILRGTAECPECFEKATPDCKFEVGNKVKKVGGDYSFEGTVVAVFKKLSGLVRIVVEDDRGVLHVYSEKNLERRPEPLPVVKFDPDKVEFGGYCVQCIMGGFGDHGHPKCEKRKPRIIFCEKCKKINGGTYFEEDNHLSIFTPDFCTCGDKQ